MPRFFASARIDLGVGTRLRLVGAFFIGAFLISPFVIGSFVIGPLLIGPLLIGWAEQILTEQISIEQVIRLDELVFVFFVVFSDFLVGNLLGFRFHCRLVIGP